MSDLLRDLMRREAEFLAESNIEHRPTIGDMYEGLSRDVMSKAIPNNLDLRLVSGFIVNDEAEMSGQIDCMLVRGEGAVVPYTDKYTWHVSNVEAVFEIKKTLTKPILADAMKHLASVAAMELAHWESGHSPTDPDPTIPVRNFAQMTGRIPDVAQLESLEPELRMLYSVLAKEYLGAVRIVLGYGGWQSESSLRNALGDILADNVGSAGLGAASLPHLIVNGDVCLVKANGQPYLAPLLTGNWWPLYFSTSVNPVLLMLELIWTRLDVRYGLGNPWGDDLQVETPRPFLLAKGVDRDGVRGWDYQVVGAANVNGPAEFEDWEPAYVTDQEAVVLQMLMTHGEIELADAGLATFLSEGGVDADEMWARLLATHLVARTADGLRVALITRECALACDPQAGWVAGENWTGRLTRWIENRAVARSSERESRED